MNHYPTPKQALLNVIAATVDSVDTVVLMTETAWTLHRHAAWQLDQRYDTPNGGWDALISLAVGAKFFAATHDRFIVEEGAQARLESMDDAEVSQALLGAFTKALIPPQAFAGLVVIFGIHPLDGMRLVQRRKNAEVNQMSPLTPGLESLDELDVFLNGVMDAIDACITQFTGNVPKADVTRALTETIVKLILNSGGFGLDMSSMTLATVNEICASIIDATYVPAGRVYVVNDATYGFMDLFPWEDDGRRTVFNYLGKTNFVHH